MFDHIGLRVKDLEAASRLYAAMLAPLGHKPGASGEGYAGFGPKGAPAVDGFHAAGLKAGAKDNGAPRLRAEYGSNYYAAFLVDLDGNNVEAVCMR